MDPFKITEPTVISFSGGRTSAYMLWRVLQSNSGMPDEAIAVFANTGKEVEPTLRFIRDCETNWGVKIHWVEWRSNDPRFEGVNFETASRNGEPFEQCIKYYRKLPNPVQRWCTGKLKISTIHRYVKSLGWDHNRDDNSDFVGIRADEMRRAAKMRREKIPLVTAGVTKQDVMDFWGKSSFDLGLPVINGQTVGGNCDLCFLKPLSQITTLVAHQPDRAIWWAKMEEWVESQDNAAVVNQTGNRFNKARPRYAEIHNFINRQQDMFEEAIPCFCGD